MVDLTPATLKRIEILFPHAHEEVSELLRLECADDLGWRPATPDGLERIRFAVLKLSNGRLDRLRDAIREAHIDWRDVLMAAGFGESVSAHESWMPGGAAS